MFISAGAGIALIIVLLAAAALLARARGDRTLLARLTSFFAILTLAGVALSAVAIGYALLFSPEVGVTVPLTIVQARMPEGIVDPQTEASVVSGGADRATLIISGLTPATRGLLLAGELAGGLTIGAVAVIALRAARALRDGDIFKFAPRAILAAAAIVLVGGIAWTVLNDIGSWRAGVEALSVWGFGAEGALADALSTGETDPSQILAEHGWLAPGQFSVTIPLWPLSVGLGLALVGAAFQTGQDLRRDVSDLRDDVSGLI